MIIAKVCDCLVGANLAAPLAEFNAIIWRNDNGVINPNFKDAVFAKIHTVTAIDAIFFIYDWIPVFSHCYLQMMLLEIRIKARR
jgi:hypothetical protein